YTANTAYHFRLAVNVPTHTYSVFVTPAGGTEQTVGTDLAFRIEQNTVTSLDWWGVNVNASSPGSTTVCNFTVRESAMATSVGRWQNAAFPSQSGTFTAEFDATPSVSPINSVVGFSLGAQNDYTGFACLARFIPSSNIDALNGVALPDALPIPYTANTAYHF